MLISSNYFPLISWKLEEKVLHASELKKQTDEHHLFLHFVNSIWGSGPRNHIPSLVNQLPAWMWFFSYEKMSFEGYRLVNIGNSYVLWEITIFSLIRTSTFSFLFIWTCQESVMSSAFFLFLPLARALFGTHTNNRFFWNGGGFNPVLMSPMLNKILRLRKNSHLGIINKSYNAAKQLQSKNTLTVPIQVFSFRTWKSFTVSQFTDVKVWTLNGKRTDG